MAEEHRFVSAIFELLQAAVALDAMVAFQPRLLPKTRRPVKGFANLCGGTECFFNLKHEILIWVFLAADFVGQTHQQTTCQL